MIWFRRSSKMLPVERMDWDRPRVAVMCVFSVVFCLLLSALAFIGGGFANSFGAAYVAVLFVVCIILMGRMRRVMAEGGGSLAA